MVELIPTINIFISGFFGLIVAVVTWQLANRREKRKLLLDLNLKKHKELTMLYVSLIANLDRVMKKTRRMEDMADVLDELAMTTAQIDFVATDSIKSKLSSVSGLLSDWSFKYSKSLPKKLGDSDWGIISSEDNKYRTQANEVYPQLRKERLELIELMKHELEEYSKSIV